MLLAVGLAFGMLSSHQQDENEQENSGSPFPLDPAFLRCQLAATRSLLSPCPLPAKDVPLG